MNEAPSSEGTEMKKVKLRMYHAEEGENESEGVRTEEWRTAETERERKRLQERRPAA